MLCSQVEGGIVSLDAVRPSCPQQGLLGFCLRPCLFPLLSKTAEDSLSVLPPHSLQVIR